MITFISTGSYTDRYPVAFGGIQISEFSIMEELAIKGYHSPINLIVIKQKGQKKEEKLFNGRLHVHRIDKPYHFSHSTDTEFRIAFAIEAKKITHKLIVNQGRQIVQLCSAVPARSFLEWDMVDSFCEEKRPKFVYSIHNSLTLVDKPSGVFATKTKEWNVQKKAELEVISKADKVICTSQSFKDFILKRYKPNKDIIYIPNSVGPYDFFKRIKKDDNPQWSKTILFLGRLSQEKRIDRVVEIFDWLIKSSYNYSLVIAGDGEERDKIINLIKKKGLRFSKKLQPLPATVHMVGMITGRKKWKVLKSSRLMICLSDYEVSPLVGYEALALGVPIIASNLDQWKELVDMGRNGFIVDGDDVKGVAEKIVEIIESDIIYRNMSLENTKKYKNDYDSEIIAKRRFDLVYGPLLKL